MSYLGAIVLGDPEQVRDRQGREGLAVLTQKLALTSSDEFVELFVGETPDVILVFL
jgi:hypothetical protein